MMMIRILHVCGVLRQCTNRRHAFGTKARNGWNVFRVLTISSHTQKSRHTHKQHVQHYRFASDHSKNNNNRNRFTVQKKIPNLESFEVRFEK